MHLIPFPVISVKIKVSKYCQMSPEDKTVMDGEHPKVQH